MTRRGVLATAVLCAAVIFLVCAVAGAMIVSPRVDAVVRDALAGSAPDRPAALLGDETYLAAELEALVVGGSVLGPVTGVDPGDGELGIERVTASLGTSVEPETCRSLLGADAFYPSGYRSRTGPGFESELLLLPSVSDAADRYGDLLRASGRCYRIEERNQDYDLLRTTVTTEVAAGTAPSDDPDGAVHWFAGLRSDEIEGEVAVVTATTGNIVQTFRLAQPIDVPALGRAVAERLAESALLTLQTRPAGALEQGYASGTPVPPSPEPTSRWALARGGMPEDPAAPLSPDFFSSAPVPALCEFEAGTLVGGELPITTGEPGGVYLHDEGISTGAHFAIDQTPTASDAAGVRRRRRLRHRLQSRRRELARLPRPLLRRRPDPRRDRPPRDRPGRLPRPGHRSRRCRGRLPGVLVLGGPPRKPTDAPRHGRDALGRRSAPRQRRADRGALRMTTARLRAARAVRPGRGILR